MKPQEEARRRPSRVLKRGSSSRIRTNLRRRLSFVEILTCMANASLVRAALTHTEEINSRKSPTYPQISRLSCANNSMKTGYACTVRDANFYIASMTSNGISLTAKDSQKALDSPNRGMSRSMETPVPTSSGPT